MLKRLLAVGDAFSQLCNVAFLPRLNETDPNESISGRSYRQGWTTAQKVIDALFYVFEKEHCKKSYEADVERAKSLLSKGMK
jgi:hypothetical protein